MFPYICVKSQPDLIYFLFIEDHLDSSDDAEAAHRERIGDDLGYQVYHVGLTRGEFPCLFMYLETRSGQNEAHVIRQSEDYLGNR